MNISNMKNMVVLKNLPSNLIDEAIIILKTNQKIKRHKYAQKDIVNNSNKIENDYIIKEAELIVNNYISSVEESKKSNDTKIAKKYNKLKIITYILSVVCYLQLIFLIY